MASDAVFYVLIAASALHALVSAGLFVRQREKFPVHGHDIVLTAILGVLLSMMSIGESLRSLLMNQTCSEANVVLYSIALVPLNVMTANSIRAWFLYKKAGERMKTLVDIVDRSDTNKDHHRQDWYTRHSTLVRVKILLCFVLIVSSLELLVILGVFFGTSDGGRDVNCANTLASIGLFSLFTGANILLMFTIVTKFKHIQDAFGIKMALKRAAYFTMPLGVVIFGSEFFSGFIENALSYTRYVDAVFLFVNVHGLIIIFLNVPVWESWGSHDHDVDIASHFELVSAIDEKSEPTSMTMKDYGFLSANLRQILHNERYLHHLESFKDHLVTEFNSEALLFYFAVHEFHKFVDVVAPSKARTIMKTRTTRAVPGVRRVLNQGRDLELPENKSAEASGSSSERSAPKNSSPHEEPRCTGGAPPLPAESPSTSTSSETSILVLDDDPLSASADICSLASSDESKEHVLSISDSAVDYHEHVTVHAGHRQIAWRAVHIFMEFISDASDTEINISHLIRTPLVRELKRAILNFDELTGDWAVAKLGDADSTYLSSPLSTSVFDAARDVAFKLLASDPFERWRIAMRRSLTKEQQAALPKSAYMAHP